MNINKILDNEFNKVDLISVNLQNILKIFIKENINDLNNIDAIEHNFKNNALINYITKELKNKYTITTDKTLGYTKEKGDYLKNIELKIKDENNQDTLRIVNYVESDLIFFSSNRQDPFKTQLRMPVAENFTNMLMLKVDKSTKLKFTNFTQRINCDEWFSGDYTLTKLDLIYEYNFLNDSQEINITTDRKPNLILNEIATKIKNTELLNEEFFDLLSLTIDADPEEIQKIKPIINSMIPPNKTIVELNEDLIKILKKPNKIKNTIKI